MVSVGLSSREYSRCRRNLCSPFTSQSTIAIPPICMAVKQLNSLRCFSGLHGAVVSERSTGPGSGKIETWLALIGRISAAVRGQTPILVFSDWWGRWRKFHLQDDLRGCQSSIDDR